MSIMNMDEFVAEMNRTLEGQYVVVHSAPTTWIGRVVRFVRNEDNVAAVLDCGRLWIEGEYAETCPAGGGKAPGPQTVKPDKAKRQASAGGYRVYIPIVTAVQPAGRPADEEK